jgi:hypothetical protein
VCVREEYLWVGIKARGVEHAADGHVVGLNKLGIGRGQGVHLGAEAGRSEQASDTAREEKWRAENVRKFDGWGNARRRQRRPCQIAKKTKLNEK